jgi:ankyrin repeat protein
MPKAATLEVARLLIEAGADVAARTRSWSHDVDAACLAAGTKNLAIFELLLGRGADATEALGHAVWGKAYDLAEAALAHGAVIDLATADGKPLLNYLICWGQIPQTMWLLERGASPNVADGRGWTAAHQAASRGNARLLRAVLEAGGDTGRHDHEGNLPRDVTRSEQLAEVLRR